MRIINSSIELATEGNADIHRITDEAAAAVTASGVQSGAVTLFTGSATSAITCLEWEAGCVIDLRRALDEIANPNRSYQHNVNNGDGNGHAHVRAALFRPSLTVPILEGKMALGIWQEIIFIDFDNRPRQRKLVVQIMGE